MESVIRDIATRIDVNAARCAVALAKLTTAQAEVVVAAASMLRGFANTHGERALVLSETAAFASLAEDEMEHARRNA